VKVYAGMDPRLSLSDVPAYARRVEAMGFDGLHVAETIHDALAVSLLVAEHTERIVIRTSVALAFVRSPTLTAYASWDLSRFSGGRFQLGLGTQIRQNIEDRMGMSWSEPVSRMREYVSVLRELFGVFADGGSPSFAGDSYRVSRMQPYFNPGPDRSTAPPPIWLGGVNAAMCELAGEVADGFVSHPTNSNPRYLDEIFRPHLDVGLAGAGRPRSAVEVVVGPAIVAGASDADVSAERERQRRMVAFLYSTPAYERTLELYGWNDLAGDLRALIRDERWEELPRVVPDDLLDTLLPTGRYDQLATVLLERFASRADGIVLGPQPDPANDGPVSALVADLRSAS
jgi:probable F420-dependent oxidoreductase